MEFIMYNDSGVELAEVLIYDNNLSSEQKAQVEGYLAWKWGLQGQLPTTHPYAAKLLPKNIEGRADFYTGTSGMCPSYSVSGVRPLAQPWMYIILLVFTVFMLAIDGWTIYTALTLAH